MSSTDTPMEISFRLDSAKLSQVLTFFLVVISVYIEMYILDTVFLL